MSFNRNLEEYQDWNEKGNGLQSSAILMFGAEEPCTVCTYTCVCIQLLISKYAYIMQWGLKVRKQGVRSSGTISLLIQETEVVENWVNREDWNSLWGMARKKIWDVLCQVTPKMGRTLTELSLAKIQVNQEIRRKATPPSLVLSAFLCWSVYMHRKCMYVNSWGILLLSSVKICHWALAQVVC